MKYCEMTGEYSEYYNYILGLVGGDEWWEDLALNMVRLFERKFYCVRPLDENMVIKARDLRARFADCKELEECTPDDEEVSVLEVLIALTLRVDGWMMANPRYGSRAAFFFSEIINALGFDVEIEGLDERIDMFLDGELLLTSDAKPSQTLWEQANVLFGEQFDLENEAFQV